METLRRVVDSMAEAARDGRRADRHRRHQGRRSRQGRRHFHQHGGHRLGAAGHRHLARPRRPRRRVLVSGDLGRHGMADHVGPRGAAVSRARWRAIAPRWPDWSRPCWPPARDLHCLRDLTRGGLAAALNEIALDAGVGIEMDEAAIPVSEPVAAACELLGLDPALRGQRRPAGGLRAAPQRPSGCWKPCAATRPPTGPAHHRPRHRRACRHGRAARPLGRPPNPRSALRRTDAADLLSAGGPMCYSYAEKADCSLPLAAQRQHFRHLQFASCQSWRCELRLEVAIPDSSVGRASGC